MFNVVSMKHLLGPQFRSFSRILPCRRSFVHFSKTVTSPELTNDTLKLRIERVVDTTVSITPLLQEWSELGNQTRITELRSIISSLHKFDRFSHALQISEWMSEQKGYKLSSVDFETRLLLIEKVHGLEEASNFLDTIPLNKRDFYVHNALLNCCKTHGSLSIAETTFQKMIDLGFASKDPRPYHTMLYLYYEADDHDMVLMFLREMDSKNMEPGGVPFGKLMSSYPRASFMDIEGMETFLSKWGDKMEPWATCFFPGLVYIEAGCKEKGLALLRRTEPLVDDKSKKTVYGCLIGMYIHAGEKEDIYRLWKLSKDILSFETFGCSDIIEAFATKGDLDGAHEVLEEWDTGDCPNLGLKDFGFRRRYVRDEAEKVVNMLGKKKKNNLESLARKLTLVHYKEDKEEERRKRVTEALEVEGRLNNRWNPKGSLALSAYTCLQYVEGRRDIDSAADILILLNKQEQVSRAMDKSRLSMKIVEAMRGGGYIGED